jgi:hypothetical protein
MAWPFSGVWEGKSLNDLPEIISSLCRAINERRQELDIVSLYSFPNIDFVTATGTEQFPTPEDISGMINGGADVGELIGQIFDGIDDMVSTFHPGDDIDDLWLLAGYDAGVARLPVHITDCWFWDSMRGILDLMTEVTVPEGTSSVFYDLTSSDIYSNFAGALGGRTENVITSLGELGAKKIFSVINVFYGGSTNEWYVNAYTANGNTRTFAGFTGYSSTVVDVVYRLGYGNTFPFDIEAVVTGINGGDYEITLPSGADPADPLEVLEIPGQVLGGSIAIEFLDEDTFTLPNGASVDYDATFRFGSNASLVTFDMSTFLTDQA